MARNRMIKPEFWTSEQVLNCSRDARLLFIGLWNFADDHGVHPASFITIKAEIFPADDFSIDEVKKLINELIQQGLLREYSIDRKSFWLVTGWHLHQRIDKPRSRYPLPESDLKFLSYGEDSANIQRSINDTSTTSRLLLGAEKKGKEKKIKEKYIREVETSPVDAFGSTYSASIEEIFSYWQETMNHPQAKLDKKRKGVIHKALQLDYSVVDLKKAINGCAQTPFNMGQNDRCQIYDDISLILRDAEHIERFINNSTHPPHENQINNANSNIMSGVL